MIPAADPHLSANLTHFTDHGLVKCDMVARSSHDHSLFCDDNSQVYYKLEEETRSTIYEASIKTYQHKTNYMGAWLALKAQYDVDGNWKAEIQVKYNILHTCVLQG